MKYFWYYLIFINLFAFCTYGIDKWKAKKGAWRVPEKTLLILALIGGSAGAIAGMMCFRHKIRKAKFMITDELTGSEISFTHANHLAFVRKKKEKCSLSHHQFAQLKC